MKIYFYTPTLISHIDLMSMGGSEKAEDETKLGRYCSGLKHAIALFLRNNVDMSIKVLDSTYYENFDRERKTYYNFNKYVAYCEQTGKEKELIQINKDVNLESFFSVHCEDLGGGDLETEIIETGFSTALGIDWELYMGLREIYSNMVDESGYYSTEEDLTFKYGTVVKLKFKDDSEFYNIWQNRHLYINEKEPLFKVSDKVEILENPEEYLRIYKQNILVYEDRKKVSRFAFNVKLGEIDEKRILSNIYDVEGSICNAIMYSSNEDFLRQIITSDFKVSENEFLTDRGTYAAASDLLHKIALEVQEEFGEVNSYSWLMDKIKSMKDCKIAGKTLSNIGDHVWSYSGKVTVDTTPEPYAEPAIIIEDVEYVCPFSAEIKKYYKFDLDVEVKKAKLRGSKVIADKYEKCLIIDESFNVEEDFYLFLVQYLDLTKTGNIINNLSHYICDLIKK